MQTPKPVIVADLFPALLENLIALLGDLDMEDWEKPTVCTPWSVKDVSTHLLGVEIGNLSYKRDRYSGFVEIDSYEHLVQLINQHNANWVNSAKYMSPKLLVELLKFTGEQVCDYFQSIDPHAVGVPVDWVSPEPAPNWLDLAREYTERWHHQQHIRDAVGKPGLKEAKYLAPILDTFILGVPRTFGSVRPEDEIAIQISTTGAVTRDWILANYNDAWRLYEGIIKNAQASVSIPADVAWRVFTKGIPLERARKQAQFAGNQKLAAKVLETISIIG